MRAALVLLGLAAVAAPALAQDLGVPAGPQRRPVVIVNATIHPVSGPAIERGWIHFAAGRILALGPMTEGWIPPTDTDVVHAAGKHVWPGLVAPFSRLGLTEIGSVRATRDFEEVGPVKPEVRAAVAINPDSTLLPVARRHGVLTAGVFPSGGVISGRAAVMRLEGWTWEEMAILPDAGLVVSWPSGRTVRAWWEERTEEQQRKDNERNLRLVVEAFDRALAYRTARRADRTVGVDVRWRAMAPTLPDGDEPPERPVFLVANDHDQIREAVAFARKRGLRPVIVGGRDAPLCVDVLKRHDVPVIVTGTYEMPRRDDSPYDERFRLPRQLEAAGIRWCLASGQPASNERNLPHAAAMAAAHGLDPDVAMRAITLSAAEILGVGDRLGSLEKGKLATLIVTDGDPLEITTSVTMAFLEGRRLDLADKQTALHEKYREKYRRLGLLR